MAADNRRKGKGVAAIRCVAGLQEAGMQEAGSLDSAVTEHSFGDLGTIAVTVVHEGRTDNFYPLTAQGLNDIHNHLRGRIPDKQTVAFPGTLLYDERKRCLKADAYTPRKRRQ